MIMIEKIIDMRPQLNLQLEHFTAVPLILESGPSNEGFLIINDEEIDFFS